MENADIISMISFFLTRHQAPEPPMPLETPGHLKNIHKNHGTLAEEYYFPYLNIMEIHCCQLGKRRAPKNDEDPSKMFLRILDMGQICT